MVPRPSKNRRLAAGSSKIEPMDEDERGAPVAIVVYRDEEIVGLHELHGEVIEIGRADGCDIPLADDTVADVHAVLERDDDGWHVVDLDASAGTLLHAAGEGALAMGDVIQIGPFMLQVASPSDLFRARARLQEIERAATEASRVGCPACGSRKPRVTMALRVPLEAVDVTVDSPGALSELRGELCPACGHLAFFVRDPAAVVLR